MKIDAKVPFGGVKFNVEVKGNVKTKNGQIIYSVKLPDKTVITFPKQSGAEVKMVTGARQQVEFSGLNGAEIKDTKKQDTYSFNNCEETSLKAAGKKKDSDIIIVNNSNKKCTFNLNKGDNIYLPPNFNSNHSALKQGFYGKEVVSDNFSIYLNGN